MPTRSLPRSIAELLTSFRSCFTAPTFETFCALVVGFWAQPQAHTVTGMLVAAGLSTSWHHSRAHRFFSRARWSADQLGLCLLELIVDGLVGAGAPVRLVVDDTLFRRSGRKIFGTGWHHDPLGVGRDAVAWGNNWVVLGVLVDLPFISHRALCLPVLARLWRPGHTPGRLDLAVELVTLVCQQLGDRRVDLVCDGAYAGKALRQLPRQVTVTTRLRADAALYQLPSPRRPHQRGRPPSKGARLPDLHHLAGLVATPFTLHQATLYGKPRTLAVAHFTCLWPSVFATRPVHVVLIRAATAPACPWNAPCRSGWSATAWRSSGTPTTATTPPTWPPAAPWRPGTRPRPPHQWPTCSPSSAASSSPRNISQVSPQPPPRQKSSKCRQPGPPPASELRNSSLQLPSA